MLYSSRTSRHTRKKKGRLNKYPEPAFEFEPIQDEQIYRAIRRLKPYKAPGSSDVANIVLMKCASQLVPYLGHIFRATFELCAYPDSWKEFTTVVLRKPGKADYTIPNAYRPIALLDVIAKVLSSCVKEVLEYHTETLQLLPQAQFGGRPGRSATDSIHILVNFIMNAWRRGRVVAALFLDVKSAFPSTKVTKLVHNMRTRGIPKEYTDWILRKMTGRKTIITFDDFKSEPIAVNNGLDQGCTLSMYLYNHYNAGQVDGSRGRRGEISGGFVDDSMGAAEGRTMQEAVENAMELFARPGGPRNGQTHMGQSMTMTSLHTSDFRGGSKGNQGQEGCCQRLGQTSESDSTPYSRRIATNSWD